MKNYWNIDIRNVVERVIYEMQMKEVLMNLYNFSVIHWLKLK